VAITNVDGGITLRTEPYLSKTITHLAADDLYLYAAHVSLSGNINELTVIYRVTGSVREQKVMGGETRSLVAFDDGVLAFIQSDEVTRVMKYDPEDLVLTQLTSLPFINLAESVKVSGDEVILLTEDNVLVYKPLNGSITVFNDQAYEYCRYDQLNDMVFLVKDNRVEGFDRASAQLKIERTTQN